MERGSGAGRQARGGEVGEMGEGRGGVGGRGVGLGRVTRATAGTRESASEPLRCLALMVGGGGGWQRQC